MIKLLKINALWCPSCLIMSNIYTKVANDYQLPLETLDYDFDQEKVEPLNVGNILPLLIIYQDDVEIKRIVGEKTYNQIIEEIELIINEKN